MDYNARSNKFYTNAHIVRDGGELRNLLDKNSYPNLKTRLLN